MSPSFLVESEVSIIADVSTRRLERIFRRLTHSKLITQALVAVESGDQSFRWAGTEGMTASGSRVVEDSPFFIASIDKLYNATVAMMLHESGQLDIDDSINSYLPSTITRGLCLYGGLDLSGKITVRHLLTHTSGLADWLEDYPKDGPSLIESILKEGDRALTIEELAAHVRNQLKPHFPPQDLTGKKLRVRYSDTNFMLIIAIIEAVTGKSLHEVHKSMLHDPLALRHTYFPGLSYPSHPTTDPVILRVLGEPLEIPLLMKSVRGIYSTVSDMIIFMRKFTKGELFQSPDTLAAMQSNWRRFDFPIDRAALRSPGWPIEYGIGLMRFRLPRLLTPTAPMPLVLGHTGSTGCWLFYCPNLDMYLAGSVDEVAAGAVPFRILPRILGVLRTLKQE